MDLDSLFLCGAFSWFVGMVACRVTLASLLSRWPMKYTFSWQFVLQWFLLASILLTEGGRRSLLLRLCAYIIVGTFGGLIYDDFDFSGGGSALFGLLNAAHHFPACLLVLTAAHTTSAPTCAALIVFEHYTVTAWSSHLWLGLHGIATRTLQLPQAGFLEVFRVLHFGVSLVLAGPLLARTLRDTASILMLHDASCSWVIAASMAAFIFSRHFYTFLPKTREPGDVSKVIGRGLQLEVVSAAMCFVTTLVWQ